jgi:hypothetical protein
MIEFREDHAVLRIQAQGTGGSIDLSAELPDEPAGIGSGVSYNVTLRNTGTGLWRGTAVCTASLESGGPDPFFLLPSFIYGTNRSDQPVHEKAKMWPRIRPGDPDPPFSPRFTVRADRLTHPAACVRAGSAAVAVTGPPSLSVPGATWPVPSGFGCFWDESGAGVIYTAGCRNQPWLYKGSRIEQDNSGEGLIEIPPGEFFVFRITFFSEGCGNRENHGIFAPLIKEVYRFYHQTPRKAASLKEGVRELARPLFEDAFNREARNYCTTLTEKEGNAVQDTGSFSISWTGGTQAACPLLLAGLRLGNEEMRAQAASCIDHIVETGLNPDSGLPFDAWSGGEWTVDGWWSRYVWSLEGKRGHSSYLIGQALYYILKGYHWERKIGDTPRQHWLGFAEEVIERIEGTKNRSGEYPYRWSAETGAAEEYDSFCGAWCLAARAYLLVLTGNKDLLPGCRESFRHYRMEYVTKMLCYGAPHDTWKAPDEEGILAFAKAARLLHEYSGDVEFLDGLREALDYEFTWKYCYNTDPGIPPLSGLNWSSSGGSVTSTANQCVHPMGNMIADEILYCWDRTGDAYYRSRLEDTVLWGLQTYNRCFREYGHGKAGWLSERFDASRVTVQFPYPDGKPASTWFVYHPWAAGCILESLSGDLWDRTDFNF